MLYRRDDNDDQSGRPNGGPHRPQSTTISCRNSYFRTSCTAQWFVSRLFSLLFVEFCVDDRPSTSDGTHSSRARVQYAAWAAGAFLMVNVALGFSLRPIEGT